MKTIRSLTLSTVLTLAVLVPAQAGEVENEKLAREVQAAITSLNARDSTFEAALKKAHGYVIFPRAGKGGFIVGGAGGDGEVYEDGRLIGRASLSQVTVGAQIGGQVFMEVILFENEAALNRFKDNEWKWSAQISAVAAEEGVGQKARFTNGAAIIILPVGGLMAEVSVGGQKFEFFPLEKE